MYVRKMFANVNEKNAPAYFGEGVSYLAESFIPSTTDGDAAVHVGATTISKTSVGPMTFLQLCRKFIACRVSLVKFVLLSVIMLNIIS